MDIIHIIHIYIYICVCLWGCWKLINPEKGGAIQILRASDSATLGRNPHDFMVTTGDFVPLAIQESYTNLCMYIYICMIIYVVNMSKPWFVPPNVGFACKMFKVPAEQR